MRVSGFFGCRCLRHGRSAGFAHGVCKREQVVVGRLERRRVGREPQDAPTPGRGQPLGMHRTEVIAVGLGQMGERTQHSSLVGIDIGQCRDRRL